MQLSKIIFNYRKKFGYSLRTFADKCNCSYQYIDRLEKNTIGKPSIVALKKIASGMNISLDELLRQMDDMVVDISLPSKEPVIELNVYAPLSCGVGLFVEDNIVATISLPKSLLPARHHDLFAQYASGDSMIDYGIEDGDLLVFSKEQCSNGDVGCFCIDENIAVCKKLRIANNQIMLMSYNDKYDPIFVDPECFRCVGKLVLKISKEK